MTLSEPSNPAKKVVLCAATFIASRLLAEGALLAERIHNLHDKKVILCPSRWKIRKAVKLMHQTLTSLGLHAHPEKTYIGRVSKGFDFLGVQFDLGKQSLSDVSRDRLNTRLTQKFSSCVRFYEQGKLRNLRLIERYLTHWLRWAKGIGIALSNALAAIAEKLRQLCAETSCLMIHTFAQWMVHWVETQQTTIYK